MILNFGLFFGPVWVKSDMSIWNSTFKDTKKFHYEKSTMKTGTTGNIV